MIAADIFVDGFFAAVAAIGFGAISDPPLRAFPSIALLAAAGHALRFGLMTCAGLDITTATLCASLLIGLGSLWLGGRIYCPTTVLSIPALLPMVPGIYAYKTVFALIMLMQHTAESDAARQYMDAFLLNATVTVSVVFMLAVGSTVPILLFRRRAFSLIAWRFSGIPSHVTMPPRGRGRSRSWQRRQCSPSCSTSARRRMSNGP